MYSDSNANHDWREFRVYDYHRNANDRLDSIRTHSYSNVNGMVLSSVQVNIYDQDLMIEEHYYQVSSQGARQKTYIQVYDEYDEAGNLLHKSFLAPSFDGWEVIEETLYIYDIKQRLISDEIIEAGFFDGRKTKYVYSYALTHPLNVLEQDTKLDLRLFPNPTSDIIRIESEKRILGIQIYDILGAERMRFDSFTGDQISLIELSPGTYFVRVESSGSAKTMKVVKF